MDADVLNPDLVAAAADVTPVLPAAPGVGGGDIVSLGVSMLIVVAAILVLGWLYSRSRFAGVGNNDAISVVASRALGPKERLLVIEVADQQLLLGMTASTVQTLHVFEQPVRVPVTAGGSTGFATRLRTALSEIRQ